MKQLSALGVRRQFYRNPRRLRALRPGEELDGADLLGQHGFNYFVGQLRIHLCLSVCLLFTCISAYCKFPKCIHGCQKLFKLADGRLSYCNGERESFLGQNAVC